MAKAPAHPVTMVIRTATLRIELKGGIREALDQLLIAVGGPEQRLQAIENLKATHERVCKLEADREAKNG